MLAPICLFTYNRLDETLKTLNALQKNYLAPESDLYIFSDGSKDENDLLKVNAVRSHLQNVSGFKSVTFYKSEENKGLANSIIYGVSQVLGKYEKVIVLEDDLITFPNFLNFMNQALSFYKADSNIQSVNGYSLYLKNKKDGVYFQHRTLSWGWATWKDRWNVDLFDKEQLRDIIKSKPTLLKEFQRKCGYDIPKMLKDSIADKNDSWYVRWAFDHFRNKHYAVFPVYSFIINIGHNKDATHCKGINTYVSSPLNTEKIEFEFPIFQPADRKISTEFLYYFSRIYKFIFRIKLLKTQTGRIQVFRELKMRAGLL